LPEGDTIFRAARTLNRALAGEPIIRFESVFATLTRVDEDRGIVGRTVEKVEARGKWILMYFSGGLVLLTHMLMRGSWHIYRPGERWRLPHSRMRIMLGTEPLVAVAFNLQIAEFHTEDSLRRRRGFSALGPSLLTSDFDEEEGARRMLAFGSQEVGEVLLKQSVVAGIGNVFKSEVCFTCRVHPFRKVSSLSQHEARTLMKVARAYLQANVTDTSWNRIVTYSGMRRTTSRSNPEERLWVYKRNGEPCRRCGALIRCAKQGPDARVTFWCPDCQTLEPELEQRNAG